MADGSRSGSEYKPDPFKPSDGQCNYRGNCKELAHPTVYVRYKKLCKFHKTLLELDAKLEIDPHYKEDFDLCAQYDEECERRDALSDAPIHTKLR